MFRNYSNYEVFDDGRIYSYKTKKFLKPQTQKNGYQVVNLYDNDGKMKKYLVHRIVYEAVSGSPIPECMQCNHINECKSDNRFCNINLMTPKQNTNYGSGIERVTKALSKQVGAFKNGELVMTFSSTNDAGRNGFDQGSVSRCCRNCFHREGNNVYKGFEWRYI